MQSALISKEHKSKEENPPENVDFEELIYNLEGPDNLIDYKESDFDPDIDFTPIKQVSQVAKISPQIFEINDTLDAFGSSKSYFQSQLEILNRSLSDNERTIKLMDFYTRLPQNSELSVLEILSFIGPKEIIPKFRKELFEKVIFLIFPLLSPNTRSYILFHFIKLKSLTDKVSEKFYSIDKQKYQIIEKDYFNLFGKLKNITTIPSPTKEEINQEEINEFNLFLDKLNWASLSGKDRIGLISFVVDEIIQKKIAITRDVYNVLSSESIKNQYNIKDVKKKQVNPKINYRNDDYDHPEDVDLDEI